MGIKTTSAEDFRLRTSFNEVRKILLDDRFSDRMEKPLAYWALPNDRRLPIAFLDRTLHDLLGSSFDDLTSTPGIGQKKIGSLVKLLHRATRDDLPAIPYGIQGLGKHDNLNQSSPGNGSFDADLVSEAHWNQWRETVRNHRLGHEKLGRLARTLRELPTVIWHLPLSHYLDLSVTEIRELKTHGEKRVRVVLEVFYEIHQMLESSVPNNYLRIQLTPEFVFPIESWCTSVMKREDAPISEEIRNALAVPLLRQIRHDISDSVHDLAAGRLGMEDRPQSVRNQSRELGVTRARVYQLLDDCARVMGVRWPEGNCMLSELTQKLVASGAQPSAIDLVRSTRDLFFPTGKEGEAE